VIAIMRKRSRNGKISSPKTGTTEVPIAQTRHSQKPFDKTPIVLVEFIVTCLFV
jgi:hypothetical protein